MLVLLISLLSMFQGGTGAEREQMTFGSYPHLYQSLQGVARVFPHV
jgi:hypothetical protein